MEEIDRLLFGVSEGIGNQLGHVSVGKWVVHMLPLAAVPHDSLGAEELQALRDRWQAVAQAVRDLRDAQIALGEHRQHLKSGRKIPAAFSQALRLTSFFGRRTWSWGRHRGWRLTIPLIIQLISWSFN
jgi:hypothetical protein